MSAAIALITVPHATATPISPIHGPLTISWTISQQNLDNSDKYPGNGKTNITGGATSKATNVLQVLTSSIKTAPFADATFLSLLENSLNTNFPAGSKLVTDGSSVYVSDAAGTNAIADISTILTITSASRVFSGVTTRTTTSKSTGETATGSGSTSGSEFYTITYNDAGLKTTDGTTSTFQFYGTSAFSSKASTSATITSGIVEKITDSGTFKITGGGYGTIRGQTVLISGTILGTPSGTETVTLP